MFAGKDGRVILVHLLRCKGLSSMEGGQGSMVIQSHPSRLTSTPNLRMQNSGNM